MASSAYRARKKALPALPANLGALNIQGVWAQTVTNRQFLLFDHQVPGGGDRVVCFCSADDLVTLCRSDSVYMDGTFRTAPHLFVQLFTLHGFVGEKQVPLVYALLTSKTANLYRCLFQQLKAHAANANLNLRPQKIMSDFESGLRAAIVIEFAHVRTFLSYMVDFNGATQSAIITM